MGLFIVIVFFALSSWELSALIRRLRRQGNTKQWVAFGVLAAGGLALGLWCGFYLEYHVGTQYRIGSFPIPTIFFHLENGQWIGFPVPSFQAWASALTNVISITAIATLPLYLMVRGARNASP